MFEKNTMKGQILLYQKKKLKDSKNIKMKVKQARNNSKLNKKLMHFCFQKAMM